MVDVPGDAETHQLAAHGTCHLCGAWMSVSTDVAGFGCVVAHDQARTGPLLTVACSECSLVQTLPHPTAEEVREYYASGQYRREFPDLPRYELDENLEPTGRTIAPGEDGYELACDRHGEHAAKRLIEMLGLSAGSFVLEVGCGDGRVAAAMVKAGIACGAIEADPGKRAEASARGVDVGPPDDDQLNDCADVVYALQVVEHFADPIGELAGIVKRAKIGGTVFVEVPTVERPYVSLSHFLQRPHVVNYSTHTLGAALKRAGLVDVRTAIDGSVLLGVGTRGHAEMQPYEPHSGPMAAEVVGRLHAWERKRAETEKAADIIERFEAMMGDVYGVQTRSTAPVELDEGEARFILGEWHRWRKMASDAAGELHAIITALEEAKREDWHPDAWTRGYLAGRIYEGQRLGVALGHVLNGLALNLNRKETK